jgi:hypothetical protein
MMDNNVTARRLVLLKCLGVRAVLLKCHGVLRSWTVDGSRWGSNSHNATLVLTQPHVGG